MRKLIAGWLRRAADALSPQVVTVICGDDMSAFHESARQRQARAADALRRAQENR